MSKIRSRLSEYIASRHADLSSARQAEIERVQIVLTHPFSTRFCVASFWEDPECRP